MTKAEIGRYLEGLIREKSRRTLNAFSTYVNEDIENQWFHKMVYRYLDRWIAKDIKKLAIFMPPQHGKSTMSSVMTPSMVLGKNPKAKVVCASYNGSVSSRFNREVQDIFTSKKYKELFPQTIIPEAGIDRDNELRNAQYFETVGQKGFYKAVGVGGSLTGTTIEYGIIDDPIKDRKEANSPTYRNNLWDWYTDVWGTRLNNESCELLLFTRWHEDDLAGRLFDPNNEHYDEEVAKQWTIIVLPALKEDTIAVKGQIETEDPRELGEALWEKKHSRETHEKDKRVNPYMFASLKQQRPAPLEGGLLKRDWFQRIKRNELPFNPHDDQIPTPMHFMIDGAFGEKTQNDPSAVIAYRVWKKNLYIFNVQSVRMHLPKYLKFVSRWIAANEHGLGSRIRIEMKSSGPALKSMLSEEQYGGYPTERINDIHVGYGKATRGEYAAPSIAGGQVYLVEGSYIEAFLKQVCTFPNDTHDDEFDLLCYSILEELTAPRFTTIETTVNL